MQTRSSHTNIQVHVNGFKEHIYEAQVHCVIMIQRNEMGKRRGRIHDQYKLNTNTMQGFFKLSLLRGLVYTGCLR